MRVVVRADASHEIGTGHVMRCLTLAGKLRARGAIVSFATREVEGHLADLIEAAGYDVHRMASAQNGDDALASRNYIGSLVDRVDLLVVDHYALDRRWEGQLRDIVGRILVVDDLADRSHDCDVLLDQNLHRHPHLRYADRVPPHARVFVGPEYALLRPEFDGQAPSPRDAGVRRLLVFMGGSDPSAEAVKVVEALRLLGASAPDTSLVLGPSNPRASQIRAAARDIPQLNVIDTTSGMAALMNAADLCVGTCGGAAWERCVLALPAIVVVTADNQREDAEILHERGAVLNLGEAADVGPAQWARQISAIAARPEALLAMSCAAAAVMAGRARATAEFEAALVS